MNDQNDPDNSPVTGSTFIPASGSGSQARATLPQSPQQRMAASGERFQPRSPLETLQPREVPPPAKRSKQARGGLVVFLNFCMSCLVFAALAAGVVFYFGKLRFEEPGPLQKAKTMVIEDGANLRSISAKLHASGITSSELIFSIGVRAHNASSALKAGEYAFKPGMSMYDVMETIHSGKGVVHKITIPEGFTIAEILRRVAADETLEGEMPQTVPPEGTLMPDTYPFQRGTTRIEVIEQMRKSQQRYLAELWGRRIDDLPVNTPQELVTLASIVEKETGKAYERPHVASVFINRLKKGMRLQSDPTIIYGIFAGEGKPKDRPIYKSDIDKYTPYNTYQIDGLPPGPIANPGRAALEAVANPSRTEYLYFVASGDGGHVFAKTLDEHNANVARWRAIEKREQSETENVEKK